MLDSDDWPARLNAEFYDQDPTHYFRERLLLLALRAARGAELDELVGFPWGDLYVGETRTERSDAERAELTDRYAVTESQVLLHHVAEAAIRLFLAHAQNPECPWIAMAALMSHREFRDRVDELALDPLPQWVVDVGCWTLLGRVPGKVPEDEARALEPSLRLLSTLARRVNGDANLYNSAKHGMTLLPGADSVAIERDSGELVVLADGTRVTYLERETVSKEERNWHQTHRWVSAQGSYALTHLAIELMDGIWSVARARYLGEPVARRYLTNSAALDALEEVFGAAEAAKFSLHIGTERRHERP